MLFARVDRRDPVAAEAQSADCVSGGGAVTEGKVVEGCITFHVNLALSSTKLERKAGRPIRPSSSIPL